MGCYLGKWWSQIMNCIEYDRKVAIFLHIFLRTSSSGHEKFDPTLAPRKENISQGNWDPLTCSSQSRNNEILDVQMRSAFSVSRKLSDRNSCFCNMGSTKNILSNFEKNRNFCLYRMTINIYISFFHLTCDSPLRMTRMLQTVWRGGAEQKIRPSTFPGSSWSRGCWRLVVDPPTFRGCKVYLKGLNWSNLWWKCNVKVTF